MRHSVLCQYCACFVVGFSLVQSDGIACVTLETPAGAQKAFKPVKEEGTSHMLILWYSHLAHMKLCMQSDTSKIGVCSWVLAKQESTGSCLSRLM